jgi:hypothetical protein
MNTKVVSDLYAWSKDLESSSDVLHREIPAFAMLLGWLEKFLGARGLKPGREACYRIGTVPLWSFRRKAHTDGELLGV